MLTSTEEFLKRKIHGKLKRELQIHIFGENANLDLIFKGNRDKFACFVEEIANEISDYLDCQLLVDEVDKDLSRFKELDSFVAYWTLRADIGE